MNVMKRKNDSFKVITKKPKKLSEEDSEKLESLSEALFGNTETFLRNVVDTEVSLDCSVIQNTEKKQRKAVWQDEDDEEINVGTALKSQGRNLPDGGINEKTSKYSNLLKHKFQATYGSPKWADLDKNEADYDSDDEILRSCGHVSKQKSLVLPPGAIEYKNLTDLNFETRNEGPFIQTTEFHPTSTVALIAGRSGIASLFAVDGKRNTKLHSILFQQFPIHCAKFVRDGNSAIFGSQRDYMQCYNLETAQACKVKLPREMTNMKYFEVSPDEKMLACAGKWGQVYLIEGKSKELLATLKQDTDVTALEFSNSGEKLFGHGKMGEVTIWDINMRKVSHKFFDDGCIQGTKLAMSKSGQFLATGSAEGVVNLYDSQKVFSENNPKPVKTCVNLTTKISALKFNPTSEILAFASDDKKNAVKLLHVNSKTVFSNWPNMSTKVGCPCSVSFSPGGGYLGIGNTKSTVNLLRIKHYQHY